MAISCESHGGKSTMLVGSMFHWYKAKHLKSTRIFIRRQFSGLASLPNFAFFVIFFAKGDFLKKSPENQEIEDFLGPNFALRAVSKMANFCLLRA
jgi:hypothetical protein